MSNFKPKDVIVKEKFKAVPQLPQNRQLELEDKVLFDVLFKKRQPEISEFTFTNLFCWRDVYAIRISRLKDFLIVSSFKENLCFFEPIGEGNMLEAVKICLNEFAHARFFRLSPTITQSLAKENGFQLKEDRDNFDYLYRAEDLTNLSGKRYDAKRNFIKRFNKEYNAIYREMLPPDIERAIGFQRQWCDLRLCDKNIGLDKDRKATIEMLNNFKVLNLRGAVIEIDGKIQSLALGERLNDATFVVHAEKANQKFTGIYQAINHFFASLVSKDFSFINREQDLGIINLRKAKESYHPCNFIKKSTLSLVKE